MLLDPITIEMYINNSDIRFHVTFNHVINIHSELKKKIPTNTFIFI